MIACVLSFAAGIIIVQQLVVLPDTFYLGIIFLLSLILAYRRYWIILFFSIGLLWALSFASFRLADKLPDNIQGLPIIVEGKVVGLPEYDERKIRFDFSVIKPDSDFPKKIRLSWYSPRQKIKPGQHWKLNVKLKKPHGRFNPGDFDYERWLFMHNIGATGYVRSKPPAQLINTDPIWRNTDSIRQVISEKLFELIPQIEHLAIIKALTLGVKYDISNKQWDVFRSTGTAHLLAISGLHIGLISGLVYWLVLKISIRLMVNSPQVIAAVFAIVMALFYSALAGFSLPTQRALIMLSVAMTAIVWQRHSAPVNTLALAVMVVLIFDPIAVMSVGFWLSFTAVTLIIYCLSGRLGQATYWNSALKIHWITAIGLAPVLLYSFNQASVIAPIANLITVPVVSLLVVPVCLIAVFLMFILPVVAKQLFLLVNDIMQILWEALLVMSDLPYAVIPVSSISFYVVPLALIGVFILISPKGIPSRWLGVVFLLPIYNSEEKTLKPGELSMTVLDVGQGLASVIETSTHVLLFDTGAKYSNRFDMGNAVIIPFLNRQGIEKVDSLLISHGDNDHSGGADSIIQNISVKKVITSSVKEQDKFNTVLCQAGQSWVWDQVEFEMLSPLKNGFLTENNNSCVLKVNSKYGSILLTGDIESEAEQWLVEHYEEKLSSDILLSPHHGSNTSSTLPFLIAVNPKVIIIPSGYRNRYGFPHEAVLQRYETINASWFNTADKGALSIELNNRTMKVESERERRSKYWNNRLDMQN